MVSTPHGIGQRLRLPHRKNDEGESPLPFFQSQNGPNGSMPSDNKGPLKDQDYQQHHHGHAGEATTAALNQTRKALGLRADPPASAAKPMKNTHIKWNRIRLILREPILEFWGTFIYVLFGDSVIAQMKLSGQEYGSWVSVCFGWGIGLMFGIYVAGDSGAYLNPAITLTNCIFRGIPLKRFPIYTMAQLLGAFCAHGIVYANNWRAIDEYEGAGLRTVPPSETSSATIFCAFPAGAFVPKGSQVLCEFIANFTVTFCIFALRDENGADMKGGGGSFVFAYGWLNFVLFSSFGWLTSSPINPGRDIAGRIWITIMGYEGAWTTLQNFAWIPCVIPFLACLSGGIMYDFFIYTGESPINADGWGLQGFWYLFTCGRRKRLPGDHEYPDGDYGAMKQNLSSTSSAAELGFGSVRSLEAGNGAAGYYGQQQDGNNNNNTMQGASKQRSHGHTPAAYDDSHGAETADLEYKEGKDDPYDKKQNRGHQKEDQQQQQQQQEQQWEDDRGEGQATTTGSNATPNASLPMNSMGSQFRSGGMHDVNSPDYFGKQPSQSQQQQQQQQQHNQSQPQPPPQQGGPSRRPTARQNGTLNSIASRRGRYDDMATPTTRQSTRQSNHPLGQTSTGAAAPAVSERQRPKKWQWQWSSRWSDAELGKKIGKDSYYGYKRS